MTVMRALTTGGRLSPIDLPTEGTGPVSRPPMAPVSPPSPPNLSSMVTRLLLVASMEVLEGNGREHIQAMSVG